MAYNILVADDDILSRKLMLSVLSNDKNAVYSVLEARNATEALDIVGRGHIDLVLLDWQMPDMSGLEAMKLIKRMDRMIPVIIVTGLIDSKDLSYALDMGANDYIKKPIDKAEFRARIRCALMLRDSMLEIQNKNKSRISDWERSCGAAAPPLHGASRRLLLRHHLLHLASRS